MALSGLPEDVERFLARADRAALAGLLLAVSARLLQEQPADTGKPDEDRVLTAKEAARLFSVSRSFLYERGMELGFATRPAGARKMLFRERDLRRWAKGRRE